MSRLYRYACTLYPEVDDHYKQFDLERFTFLIAGLETCPTTKRQHYQMYLECKTASVKRIQKWLHSNCHIEVARGNAQSNITYCSKEGRVIVNHGAPSAGQGARMDWVRVKEMIQSGADDRMIMEEFPNLFALNFRGIERMRQVLTPKPSEEEKKCFFISGPPGCGKTRYVHAEEKNLYVLPGSRNTPWWTGYNGEEAILIDDIQPRQFMRNELLTWCDRYPVQVHIGQGGNSVWLRAKRIYFTSNYQIEDIVPGEAFKRRLHSIVLPMQPL